MGLLHPGAIKHAVHRGAFDRRVVLCGGERLDGELDAGDFERRHGHYERLPYCSAALDRSAALADAPISIIDIPTLGEGVTEADYMAATEKLRPIDWDRFHHGWFEIADASDCASGVCPTK